MPYKNRYESQKRVRTELDRLSKLDEGNRAEPGKEKFHYQRIANTAREALQNPQSRMANRRINEVMAQAGMGTIQDKGIAKDAEGGIGDWGLAYGTLPVVSSNIETAGYNPDTEILTIKFHSGGEYEFFDVKPHVFQELIKAPSKGKYFNANIKNNYQYRQIAGSFRGKVYKGKSHRRFRGESVKKLDKYR